MNARPLIICAALAAPAWAGWFGPSDFNECLLENMKGVSSDSAAYAVATACRAKFPLPPPKPPTAEEQAKMKEQQQEREKEWAASEEKRKKQHQQLERINQQMLDNLERNDKASSPADHAPPTPTQSPRTGSNWWDK